MLPALPILYNPESEPLQAVRILHRNEEALYVYLQRIKDAFNDTVETTVADSEAPIGILSINALSARQQFLTATADANVLLSITSTDATHTFSAAFRNGVTGSGAVVLTLSPTITTATLNAPSIDRIANLTTNGFVKTTLGNGTLSVDSTSTFVNQVTNSDGSLTISPTTGNVIASLNVAHANIWTATQTFTTAAPLQLNGTTSGSVTLRATPVTSTYTLQLPPNDGNALDVLQTDGSGITTWVPPSSFGAGVGSLDSPDSSLIFTPASGTPVHGTINMAHTNIWTILQGINFNIGTMVTPITDTIVQLQGRDGFHSFMFWNAWGAAATTAPTVIGTGTTGTRAAPGAINAGGAMYRVFGRSHDGTAYSGNVVGYNMKAWNNWTTADHSAFMAFFTTPTGPAGVASGLVQMAHFSPAGGLNVGSTATPSAAAGDTADGTINAMVGYTVGQAVPAVGRVLRSDGTRFVSAQAAAADLSNGTTGTGLLVLQTSPTLITPTLGVASATSLTLTGTGQLLTVNEGTGTFFTTDQSLTTQLIVGIWSNVGKNAWLSLVENGGTPSWSIGILNTDTNLYIKSGTVGTSGTNRVIIPASGSLTFDFGGVAHTVAYGTTANTITFPNTTSDTVAMLAVANVFTALQNITVATGPVLTLNISDSGTLVGSGATFTMFNTSTGNNTRSAFSMSFANSTGAANEAIVRISSQRTDNTVGAQSGQLDITTRRAGAVAIRMSIINGINILNAGAAITGGDKGAGTLNTAVAYYLSGQAVALFATASELALGDASQTTRVRSSLAVPGTLTDGDWWVECTGTSPTRICAIKVRDAGATRTIASFTY